MSVFWRIDSKPFSDRWIEMRLSCGEQVLVFEGKPETRLRSHKCLSGFYRQFFENTHLSFFSTHSQ